MLPVGIGYSLTSCQGQVMHGTMSQHSHYWLAPWVNHLSIVTEAICSQVFIVSEVVVNILVHKIFSEFKIIISGYSPRSKIIGSKGKKKSDLWSLLPNKMRWTSLQVHSERLPTSRTQSIIVTLMQNIFNKKRLATTNRHFFSNITCPIGETQAKLSCEPKGRKFNIYLFEVYYVSNTTSHLLFHLSHI